MVVIYEQTRIRG